jgi:hypothetical protein
MAVGNEDVAIGGDGNVGNAIEGGFGIARNSRCSEREQNLAFGTEFKNLLAAPIASLSIQKPCALLNGISVRLLTKLPSESNLTM